MRLEAGSEVRVNVSLLLPTADFGLSKIIDDQVTMKTVCGTPGYCGEPPFFPAFIGNHESQKLSGCSLGWNQFPGPIWALDQQH